MSVCTSNGTRSPRIYTLSLHDALPILESRGQADDRLLFLNRALEFAPLGNARARVLSGAPETRDRKSTRLNSSHLVISYAVFCLKKKNDTPDRHLEAHAASQSHDLLAA